jgi:hypothetical protein
LIGKNRVNPREPSLDAAVFFWSDTRLVLFASGSVGGYCIGPVENPGLTLIVPILFSNQKGSCMARYLGP